MENQDEIQQKLKNYETLERIAEIYSIDIKKDKETNTSRILVHNGGYAHTMAKVEYIKSIDEAIPEIIKQITEKLQNAVQNDQSEIIGVSSRLAKRTKLINYLKQWGIKCM